MTMGWVILSIVVPWAAGAAVVRALGRESASRWFVVGAGFMVGQVLAGAMLYLSFWATGSGHARWLLVLIGALGLAALAEQRSATRTTKLVEVENTGVAISRWTYFVIGLIGLGLLWKLRILYWATTMFPFRADDAITIWLYRAKVITILDHLSFDPADAYFHGGSNPRYPLLVSLIAAWSPMVSRGWDEYLAVVPWLLFGANLVLVMVGVLGRLMPALGAWMIAYIVFSLPLLTAHIYLPGYADLPLACFLATAVGSLIRWRQEGCGRSLGLGVLLLAACALAKREGPIVALIAAMAMLGPAARGIVRNRDGRIRWALVACGAAVVVGLGFALDLRDIRDSVRGLTYTAGTGPALVRHAFEWMSFGPAYWLLGAGLMFLLFAKAAPLRVSAWILVAGLAGYVLLVFLSPIQARFALNDQTPSRLFLQGAPASILVVASALATARWRARGAESKTPDSTAATARAASPGGSQACMKFGC